MLPQNGNKMFESRTSEYSIASEVKLRKSKRRNVSILGEWSCVANGQCANVPFAIHPELIDDLQNVSVTDSASD